MSGSKGQEIVYTWARLNTPTHKELSDTIDAALRRAKAEVLEKVSNDFHAQYGNGIGRVISIVEVQAFLDTRVVHYAAARAAQIEEGDK